MLQLLGSIPKMIICRCVIRNEAWPLFFIRAEQSTRCVDPAKQINSKQNSKSDALRWCG